MYLPIILVFRGTIQTEISGFFPGVCPFLDPLAARLAHICMNGTVAKPFGHQCFVLDGFDYIANHTFHSHVNTPIDFLFLKYTILADACREGWPFSGKNHSLTVYFLLRPSFFESLLIYLSMRIVPNIKWYRDLNHAG